MFEQALEELEDRRIVHPVKVVQHQGPVPTGRLEIIDQGGGENRNRRQGRQRQEFLGRRQGSSLEAVEGGPEVAQEETEVPVGLVQGDPGKGARSPLQPGAVLALWAV